MANKKEYKAFVSFLESTGFEYDRTNSKEVDYFIHPGYGEIGVAQSIDNAKARQLTARIQKKLGIATQKDTRKRNPEQIRARQAAERERLIGAIERHDKELAAIRADLDARLGGRGIGLTQGEIRSIEAEIERREREIRQWQKLMTEIPSVNAHSGRNKVEHRA